MRVIFQPAGGFGQVGGFIEVADKAIPSGKEPVYQHQGHLHVQLMCRDLALHNRYIALNGPPAPEPDGAEKPHAQVDRSGKRRISGMADIQRTRWGRFSLSFLGSTQEHSTVDVSIREDAEVTRVYVAGTKALDDIDLNEPERFFIEIVVSPETMTNLLEDLQQPRTGLAVNIQLGMFPNLFATWSPSIGEGRVVKFLDSRDDIENAGEVPTDFWKDDLRARMLSDSQDPPIILTVRRPLRDADDALLIAVDDTDAQIEVSAPIEGTPQYGDSQVSVLPFAIKAANGISRAIWGLYLVILLSAFIVAS